MLLPLHPALKKKAGPYTVILSDSVPVRLYHNNILHFFEEHYIFAMSSWERILMPLLVSFASAVLVSATRKIMYA